MKSKESQSSKVKLITEHNKSRTLFALVETKKRI